MIFLRMIVFFTRFFNSLSYTENEFMICIISRFLYHEYKRATEFEYLYIFANTYWGLFYICLQYRKCANSFGA